jgi:hypothetical protein
VLPGILVEGIDHPAPGFALAVVDLAEIQHRPLHHLAAGAALALDDAPIAMLLAVFEASVGAQEHGGADHIPRPKSTKELRSPLHKIADSRPLKSHAFLPLIDLKMGDSGAQLRKSG